MENTGKILFEDDTKPLWFIALGDRWVGPLSATEVYEKILNQEITWAHYVWKSGLDDWKRICDVPTFQAAVPSRPAEDIQIEVKEAAAPVIKTVSKSGQKTTPPKIPVKERTWYLYYNETQFGPFSFQEVCRFLKIGKIHGRVHAWETGMDDWEKLQDIDQFRASVSESKKSPPKVPSKSETNKPKSDEQRRGPRKPLIARIVMADENSVVMGICRDISIGGMQVLTDEIPGLPGTKIKLNVSPAGDKRGGSIGPFVAEGTIVRILEDGRGFSFRFEKLPEEARRAIETYIVE